MGRPGTTWTATYCSGFPVVSDTALLSSARQVFSSLMASAETLVSIRRFGMAGYTDRGPPGPQRTAP